MFEIDEKRPDQRDRELFLGHIVIWGTIISALVMAIALAHFSSPEKDETASPTEAKAASEIMKSEHD